MKENIYDDEKFFEKYRRFPRSVEGLGAAGEWHELKNMLPNFNGRRVLDIGCGFGWHCNYAVENGALAVLGIDISEKMLAVAREKTISPVVEYRRMAMEDMAFAPDSFDVVISSLAFHYTPNFGGICKRIARCLASGGSFVFSVEHPVFTAHGTQDWNYNENGNRIDWPVDNYYYESERKTVFLGETVVKYHKTLTTYLNTLLQAGFMIKKIVEPQPDKRFLDTTPEMRDELRRPMMLLVSAYKK